MPILKYAVIRELPEQFSISSGTEWKVVHIRSPPSPVSMKITVKLFYHREGN